MLAYCGLMCDGCPIYWATREKSKEKKGKMRATIAQQCSEQYGLEYGLEYTLKDITDCDGCRTTGGRLFSGCKSCPIRECAVQKELESCAYCSEYACNKLKELFVTDPSAKTRLEVIRSIL